METISLVSDIIVALIVIGVLSTFVWFGIIFFIEWVKHLVSTRRKK